MKKFQFVMLALGFSLFSTAFFSSGLSCAKQANHLMYEIDAVLERDNVVDIVIVGSGPGGLAAAVYGARGNMDTLVIEGNKPGGLLTETTDVENWPGEISILGPDIVKRMKAQAMHVGARFLTDAVESVDLNQWPFKLETEGGKTIYAMSMIVSTGATPRRLGVAGEDTYWGSGVTSCAVCDAPFFKGENVVVIGGGDSAVEEAIQLAPFVNKVTVLVRKNKMRAAPSMQDRLKGYSNIEVKYHLQVQEVLGDGNQVTGVKLLNNETQEVFDMPIAGVFLAIGHDPNTKLFEGQLALGNGGYIELIHGRSQEASVPGVFAAGDVEDHVYRQAGVAAGSGIRAALDAIGFLNDIGLNEDITDQLKTKRFAASGEQKKGAVQLITNMDEFNQLNESSQVAIVDFFADYCPSCMQMLPVFEAASADFADKIAFAKVDAQEAEEVVEKLFVHKVPCLMVFKDGQLAARYNGTMSQKELNTFLEQFA